MTDFNKRKAPGHTELIIPHSVACTVNAGDRLMADNGGSGGIGILGVIVGAVIVVALGYMFLANGNFSGHGPSTNVKIEVPKGK
jgi:hypothetical protein